MTLSVPSSPAKPLNWAATCSSVGFSTIGGAIVGGLPGALVGLCSSVADEYLIHYEYEKKHFLTGSLFWSSGVIFPFAQACVALTSGLNTPLVATASLVTGCLATYFSDDFISFEEKLSVPLDCFMTLNRFFDEEEILSKKEFYKVYQTLVKNPLEGLKLIYSDLRALYHNDFFTSNVKLLISEMLGVTVNKACLVYLAHYSHNLFISAWVNEHKRFLDQLIEPPLTSINIEFLKNILQKCSGILLEGAKIIGILLAQKGFHLASEVFWLKTRSEINEQIFSKSMNLVMQGDNGQRVLAHPNGEEILHSMLNDICILFYLGSSTLEQVHSKAYNALFSFAQIQQFSKAAFLPYFLGAIPLQSGLKQLGHASRVVSDERIKIDTQTWNLIGNMTYCLESIKLRDATEFYKRKFKYLKHKNSELDYKKEAITKINHEIQSLYGYLYSFIDMIFQGFQVLTGHMTIGDLPLFNSSMKTASEYLSTNLQFLIETSDLIAAKKRIDQFFEILENSELTQAKQSANSDGKITFKNYTLSLNQEQLIHIDQYSFEAGKRYAITGKSGAGKTTTLIDMKQGVYGELQSSGEISTCSIENRKPKLMFIDQNLFLPQMSTLLESICFPKLLEELSTQEQQLFRDKVLSLFEELSIDNFSDREEELGLAANLDNEHYKLSGGQRKKIGLIQAIFAQPDILILDEIFTGLDPKSLIKCQQAILKYLPKATILAVDHHAHENNYEGFYDAEVNFSEGTLCEKEIQPSIFKLKSK